MIDLVKKLTEAYGPSGREEEVLNLILSELDGYIDGYKFDNLGNLLVWKTGSSGKKVLLDAHADEIGLVVTNIDEKGFLRVETVGGVPPHPYVGQRIRFPNAVGIVYVEGETVEERKKNFSNLNFDNMFVDIGAKSYEEAKSKVPIGSFGVYDSYFFQNGNLLVSKAMDDRIGCAVIVEVFRRLKKVQNTVIGSFSVQEEVGLVGASVAAYSLNPDVCIAVDVTDSADYPKATKRHSMALGKGPAIKIKDRASISNRKIVEKLIETAEASKIPYQMEVLIFGGTNAAALQRTRAGIPAATVSIPTRYVHTPSETVCLDDVEHTVELLIEYSQKGV
ncbi:M42 family metallopeptidase [Pseudothermotoga thermarum]|uniref:Peptidase M42 family protein n=1 Tax=Pseudothermotoga thermarum DSM 5069 TaxID=688269 RepID=F7YWR5_9THEM|nr:M42 family metallopeptidase [Pseudothermotoga thermarum]AEH50187.1 peptidase M42 family protein [Pseudothermotoga thermarum DSM 5069]